MSELADASKAMFAPVSTLVAFSENFATGDLSITVMKDVVVAALALLSKTVSVTVNVPADE